jgi:SAM-dependent methyltransferase
MPVTTSYSERFQDAAAIADYESREYAAGSYSSRIWELQKPALEKMVADFCRGKTGVRLLDFACGTGRVISVLEASAAEADGIDISAGMVGIARTKCRRANFQVGDILSQPELLQKRYEVITAFRFLLNAGPEIRLPVLKKLRGALNPGGLLIANVHGSSRSLRHPAILWRRRHNKNPDSMLNEMSPRETENLFRESGFQIVERLGFGLLPPTLYRTPLRGAAFVFDRALAGENCFSPVAIDVVYVCHPA